jgi:hypothetical protein
MSNLTVILLGTGKADNHGFYVLNKLYDAITGKKYRVSGPNTLGTNVETKVKLAMEEIWKNKPNKLNIIGHSRGAIECIIIAGELKNMKAGQYSKYLSGKIKLDSWKKHKGWKSPDEINILVYDPVSRTKARGEKHQIGNNVKRFFCVAMKNEASKTIFGLQRLQLPGRSKGESYLPLPGTHGSAVQYLNDTQFPIGEVGFIIGCRFLDQCGVPQKPAKAIGDKALIDAYCKINLKCPIRKTSIRNQLARDYYDVAKKKGKWVATSKKSVKKGSSATRVTRIKNKLGYTYRWDSFFINAHHAKLCKQNYGTIYKLLLADPKSRKGWQAELNKAWPPKHFKELAEKVFKSNINVAVPSNMDTIVVPKL